MLKKKREKVQFFLSYKKGGEVKGGKEEGEQESTVPLYSRNIKKRQMCIFLAG